MGLIKKFFAQTRKPEGFLGSLMLSGMNLGHARGADWALDFLKDVSPSSIVDLGCGGGRNVKETLSRYPDAKVAAVDYSCGRSTSPRRLKPSISGPIWRNALRKFAAF